MNCRYRYKASWRLGGSHRPIRAVWRCCRVRAAGPRRTLRRLREVVGHNGDGALHPWVPAAVEAQEVYERALGERERAEGTHEAYAEEDRTAQLAVAHAAARAEAIEGALQGMGDPEARERAAGADGVVGAVAARLDVPEHLAVAVDAALGGWSEAFVAEIFAISRFDLTSRSTRIEQGGLRAEFAPHEILVPETWVLSTGIFDRFVEQNQLED